MFEKEGNDRGRFAEVAAGSRRHNFHFVQYYEGILSRAALSFAYSHQTASKTSWTAIGGSNATIGLIDTTVSKYGHRRVECDNQFDQHSSIEVLRVQEGGRYVDIISSPSHTSQICTLNSLK